MDGEFQRALLIITGLLLGKTHDGKNDRGDDDQDRLHCEKFVSLISSGG